MALVSSDVNAGDDILASHHNGLIDDIEQHDHDGTDTTGVLIPKQITVTPGSAVIGVDINQDYNAVAMRIDSSPASTTADMLDLTNNGTQHGVYLLIAGVKATDRYGLYVRSTVAQTNAGGLVRFENTNGSTTRPTLEVLGAGTGATLSVTASANANGVYSSISGGTNKAAVFGTNSEAGGYGVEGSVAGAGVAFGVYGYANTNSSNQGVHGFHDLATNGSIAIGSITDAADNNYGFITSDNIAAANKGAFISDAFINQDTVNLKAGDIVKLNSEPLYFEPYKSPRIPIPGIVLNDKDDDIETLGIVAEPAGVHFEGTDDEKTDYTDNESKEVKPGGRVYVVTCGAFAHCKVDTQYGGIKRGYRLTSSATKGCARVADVSIDKYIFARALEEAPANSGIKYISVLVSMR